MYKLGVILLILVKGFTLALEDSSTPANKSIDEGSRVLSRRKRYLVFPDGSSFQLVFCTQTHGYLQVGDIVWFGTTAALAWELPTDPSIFHFFKDHEKDYATNRNGVSKLIYFLDQNGKVLSKVPYKRKPIVNPAFAKRSVDIGETRKMLHTNQKLLHSHLDTNSIDFHRTGRKSFYGQLEKFIKALGWNGRECVLRMLCEAGKDKLAQGMFLEEIIRAIFTLPAERSTIELYDVAHHSQGACEELYHCEERYAINV